MFIYSPSPKTKVSLARLQAAGVCLAQDISVSDPNRQGGRLTSLYVGEKNTYKNGLIIHGSLHGYFTHSTEKTSLVIGLFLGPPCILCLNSKSESLQARKFLAFLDLTDLNTQSIERIHQHF